MSAQQPNVVLVMNDQWRYNSLGTWDPLVQTPVLDRLATEGVHLRSAYCSSPVCSPARASWLITPPFKRGDLSPHPPVALTAFSPSK